ncbi:MAG: ABC transporter substrate-binding protein [Dehalococcoidales bacterium]|nr:ABC transporter substrate-binding protein [Dehalococcoidales bacterium]
MKREIIWVVVSGLMVLSLVATACAPAVVEQPKVEQPKVETPKVVEEPKVTEPTVEKPRYGGVLRVVQTDDTTSWDDIVGSTHSGRPKMLTNEPLTSGDWAKGPAGGYGSNETDWVERGLAFENNLRGGYLAESWEFPKSMEGDKATLIFHIRKGVNFALNPESEASRLVGGREMTVDDILYNLNLQITDTRSFVYRTNPELLDAKITSPAPWTIQIEVKWEAFESAVTRFGGHVHTFPKEVYEKWGPLAFTDWKKSVGTGPFILKNNVPGSSATLVRNPSYWMKNPVGPGKGDQLPYLDGVKYFIIPDKSTRVAALRTGQVDVLAEKDYLAWEEGLILQQTALDWMTVQAYNQRTGGGRPVQMNLTKAPYNDIRVRRALFMAIDFETINEHLYDGRGFIYSQPIPDPMDFPAAYFGPDPKTGAWPSDTPQSVKEIFTYSPEKAKQLLAEAGYPQGFKSTLTISNDDETIDYFSIYVDYWRKIDVEVELKPMESAALTTFQRSGANDAMAQMTSASRARSYELQFWTGHAGYNTMGADPEQLAVANEAFGKVQSALFFDKPEADRVWRELNKYAMDHVWGINVIAKPQWFTWPAWLKNYSGERMVSFGVAKDFYRWLWIDQELKRSLGY